VHGVSAAASSRGWTPEALARVGELRGWTAAAIERLELAHGRQRVLFPVRDETGELVGELRYQPDPALRADGERKMLAAAGTSRQLFPPPELIGDDELADGMLWLVEGEPDAARAWSLGLAAVAIPGVQGWKVEWAPRFRRSRLIVAVCCDGDEEGRDCAVRVSGDLADVGVDARLVDLGDGNDLTDFTATADTPELREHAARLLRGIALASPAAELRRERNTRLNGAGLPAISGSVPACRETGSGTESESLPFRPLGDALRDAPEEAAWLVPGMVARTLLTVLGGRPKVGKSTLAFGMLKALAHGEPFLGSPTVQTRALLLTEERQLTLNEKRIAFALADDDVHVLMRHEAGRDWPSIVEQAVAYCLEQELGVLVVDTWDKWPEFYSDSENNSGDTLTNLQPLMLAAGSDLAVLIAAHQRKGQGRHGEALRGSNAFAGAVDVILELERATGEFGEQGGRVLYGTSRLLGTPEKLALTWDATTGVYTSDSYDALQFAADKDQVAAALDDEERTKREIADRVAAGMRAERLTAILAALVDERIAFGSGRGVKGNPKRWRRRTVDDVDEPDHEQLPLGKDDEHEAESEEER
jgi:hypothetical protein